LGDLLNLSSTHELPKVWKEAQEGGFNLDLIVGILNATKQGSKESQIAFYSKVSYPELQRHLQFLKQYDLLEQYGSQDKWIVYKISKKGLEWLDYYEKNIRRQ
jgi:predicted transcriptional regulator